jgi:ribosomal protein L11 methyltransferase
MYLWRKRAEPRWLSEHENILLVHSGGKLAVIAKPERKQLQLEIACRSLHAARKLIDRFGGQTEKWPRDWLKRSVDLRKSKPLKIGNRLLISNAGSGPAFRKLPKKNRPSLFIPASAAFGTGEHATTAMSLRLLEHLTRGWKNGWSLVDLGTGSGILALAAKRFGAGHVIGVDLDPKAISVAKANARLNRIDKVHFRLTDLREWEPTGTTDVIVANLYSELLIEVLPKLKSFTWLVLSGLLCKQEREFLCVLRGNNIEIVSVKRRGKWIAVLAKCSIH